MEQNTANQPKAFCHKAFGCSIFKTKMEQTMSYKRTLIYDDLLDDVVVVDVLDHDDNSSMSRTRAAVTAIEVTKPKPSAAPVLVAV